ncbi:hypothetical protein HHX47_DHR1001275 [Lentinula edodes]|nr:hypothetical protein HHX47_DHR1001275 [Lentinula edodes]
MDRSTIASHPHIWWSNGIFFVSIHLAALVGMYCLPPTLVSWPTLALTCAMWQLAEFGITIGYHRLWSHRAFRASMGVRFVLALLGSAGFQGSIKWWCLRHRLHHRFTDDPVHDPYAATRGLLYSHMGWIFFKPTYTRMELVDRDDLDRDPGPWIHTWDPSKWVILLLHQFGLVYGLRQARDEDYKEALAYMNHKSLHGEPPREDVNEEQDSLSKSVGNASQHWSVAATKLYVREHPDRCFLLLNGWVVDVTLYLGEHPGGASLLRRYAIRLREDNEAEDQKWHDASWAFDGGLNNHSRAAVKRMKELRVAKIELPEDTRLACVKE